MQRPLTTAKLRLVADERSRSGRGSAEPVRRYRLARIHLDGRQVQAAGRHDYLKRVFD